MEVTIFAVNPTMSLRNIRKDYQKGSLDPASVSPHPMVQFEQWLNDAMDAKVHEPTAMTLSTVTAGGRPTSRVVLLKGIENGCFLFFTNHLSQKGRDLSANPACALNFFWPELERQVRVEGMAGLISEEKSLEYFQSRPRTSQISAWASPQSIVITNRKLIEARAKEIEKRFEGQESLPKPKQWGGYQVEPYLIEFWHGRPDRLHDRVLYTRQEKDWKISVLAP